MSVADDHAQQFRQLLDGRTLNQMQLEALPAVRATTRNLVIAAPTGSGKTLLAEIALLEGAARGQLGIYLVPMKAIASEKREDWLRLERAGLRIYKTTGDDEGFDPALGQVADIIVATPERWDSIMRRSLPSAMHQRLGLIVVDEVHLVGEGLRGARLEALLSRIRLGLPETRIIAMSATIPNAAELARWFNAELYVSTWRPVPLVTSIEPYEPIDVWQEDEEERSRIAIGIAREAAAAGGAVLVFCGSRKGVERLAVAMAARLRLPRPAGGTQQNATLARALAGGIGFHHAGLSREDKRAVESLFRSGAIRVLVATTTVAAGVNLPARLVIVRDLKLGSEPIGASSLLQMAGRAGRPGLETEGRCVVLAPKNQVSQIQALLGGQPIASQLGEDLTSCLNTEIAMGTIGSHTEMEQWYAGTLHARLNQDSNVVGRAMETLRHQLFIEEREGRYWTTELGRVTNAHMLRVSTAMSLDNFLAGWQDQWSDPDTVEEKLLWAICDRTAEGSEVDRTDDGGLRGELLNYDSRLAEWSGGRLRFLAVAACVLTGVPVAALELEDGDAVRASVQNELPRLLRFLARRALDRSPALPQLALASADLAAALEYGLAERGAAPLLEALRQAHPAGDQRRMQIFNRYSQLRAQGIIDLPSAMPHLPPQAVRFATRRPNLLVRIEQTSEQLVAIVEGLTGPTRIVARTGGAAGSHHWSGEARSGEPIPLARLSALDRPGWTVPITVELVALPTNPLLWSYTQATARITIPPAAAPARATTTTNKPVAQSNWSLLAHYATIRSRMLPLAGHLARRVTANEDAPSCPGCGAPMRERAGQFGRFWGCTRYPECKETINIDGGTRQRSFNGTRKGVR